MSKPPTAATLTWQADLRFEARAGNNSMLLDGDSTAGPSPVQSLAFSIAGCMAMDVVDIIRKGRHPIQGLAVQFAGNRAETHPRRFEKIVLTFVVRGDVPAAAVERAIALSREKYCSVSNSLRTDIEFSTVFEVHP
jgi:putative redox protein